MAKKKEKETIFKNTVGRPTNEIKKKRKVFTFLALFIAVATIGILLVTSYALKEGSSLNLYASTKSKHPISMKKINNGILDLEESERFKISVANGDYVNLKTDNASVVQVVTHGDNTYRNNEWALKGRKAGTATVIAETYGFVKGKKKVYNTLKYKYTVKEHALYFNFNNVNLYVGDTTYKFKVDVSSPKDKISVLSSNTSIAQVLKYGDNSSANNKWAIKAKKAGKVTITAQAYKTVAGKKKVYNSYKRTLTIVNPTKPSLYCVSDENPSKKITEIEAHKSFRCYTDNKSGIRLSADSDGLGIGYGNTWTTEKNDYWLKLKYITPGVKTISATNNVQTTTLKINVTQSKDPALNSNNLSLYCTSDDNPNKVITEIEVNKPFRCFTNNEVGIGIRADYSDLASGYSNSYTTKENDYWLRLKYTKAGVKTISATSRTATTSIKINVTDSKKSINVTENTSSPALYCVKDSNPSVKVTSVKVGEAFRCYTDNKTGIKLSAPSSGLASGYSNSFTTEKNDYWIRLKYTKAGSKSIYAVYGSKQTNLTITVK